MENQPSGLSEIDAKKLLGQWGPNDLSYSVQHGKWWTLLHSLKEPAFLLLLAATAIYFVLGDFFDGVVLLLSILSILGITFIQENKSYKALSKLRELSAPRAMVIRNGQERRVASQELVPGDLIALYEGDRIPADALLLETSYFKADESMVTGESGAVMKSVNDPLFTGTLVVGGKCLARVTQTGHHTIMGKIGKSLSYVEHEQTVLQKKMSVLVKRLAIVSLVFCFILAVSFALIYGDWAQGLLSGIAAAISLLPEEFPMVLTVFLALGAWRMSRQKVLTRNLSAIETLGSVNVLCTDKTGTLTENRMRVQELCVDGAYFQVGASSLPEDFHELVEYAALASHVDPFDPMDKAIRKTLGSTLAGTEHLRTDYKLIKEFPLTEKLRAFSCAWQAPAKDKIVVASKGAPETIIELCHLDPLKAQEVLAHVEAMAERGMRILGVAKAVLDTGKESLPEHPHAFSFRYLGLIGLEDPIRAEVPEAIGQCQEAGIEVIMLTGDYPVTAQKIGERLGLSSSAIYSRVLPQKKLEIVQAFKQQGKIVAMTGDGINDAPALKAADVGIAMGERGTDVAREAADIVLTDDHFTSIIAGIRSGRKIYANLKKALSYLFAVHVPIAGLAIIPVLFGHPLLLLPIHIVFLEMIIDPASTLVFEAEEEEADIMKRPPVPLFYPLFSRAELLTASFFGLVVLLVLVCALALCTYLNWAPLQVRTLLFCLLVFSNLGLILIERSFSLDFKRIFSPKNRILNLILSLTTLLIIIAVYFPPLQRVFRFYPIDWRLFLLSIFIGPAAVLFCRWVCSILLKKKSSTIPLKAISDLNHTIV